MPDAGIPELVQMMWAHLGEREPETHVLHPSGDTSGALLVDVQHEHAPRTAAGTIKVSVFGADKLFLLKGNVGEPMVFLNLSVMCSGGQMSVTHYADELWREAPACERQEALNAAQSVLTEASNITTLTTEWAPTQAAHSVSGPTPFSCAAFSADTSPPRCQTLASPS